MRFHALVFQPPQHLWRNCRHAIERAKDPVFDSERRIPQAPVTQEAEVEGRIDLEVLKMKARKGSGPAGRQRHND